MSVAAAILAGTALAPAGGQVADLGGGLVATNDFVIFNPVIAGAPFAEITNGTLRAIIAGSNAVTFGGNLTNSGGLLALRKEGTGTLTLSGNNVHSGDTLVFNGTLIAGSATALSGTSLLSLNGITGSTATLDLNGFNGSSAGLTGNLRGILTSTNGPAVLTIDSDVSRTFSGSVQGDVGIIKRGAGLQSFTQLDPVGNASNATGPITLEAGGIRVAGVNALGSGTMTVTGASSFGNALAAPTVFDNDVVLDAALSVVVRSATVLTMGGDISGTGSLIKASAGTLQLTGNNSYAGGTTLGSAGRIEVGTATALGIGAVTVNGGATLAMFDPAGSLTLGNDIALANSALRVEAGNAGTSFGLAGSISGTRDLIKSGAGTLLLSGDNSGFTGIAQINAGTLALLTSGASGAGSIRLADATSIVALADIAIASRVLGASSGAPVGATIDTGAFNVDISGAVRSANDVAALSLDKIGSGILTLSNAVTGVGGRNQLGTLTVTAGTFNLTGGLVGQIVSSAGTTVSGTGTQAAGDTTVNGILSPGDALAGVGSIGGLTLSNLTLGGSAIANFDLGAVNPGPSATTSDLVVVTGNLDLGGILNVNGLAGFGAGNYTLFTYGGALSGALTLGVLPVGYEYSLNSGAGIVSLNVALVDIYWDGSGPFGNTVVDGGSGIWNVANTNWTTISGAQTLAWQDNSRVFFTNAGGDVALNDNFVYRSLNFTADGYTVAGSGSLSANAATVDVTDGNTATVNVVLAGTGGLSKTGTGTLVLGGANTVTGGISIDDGTLAVTTAAALGPDTVTINGNGRTLRFDADMTVANNINGVGIAYQLDTNGNDVVLNGSLSGGGADKIGAGTLTLANAINAQPGALLVRDGGLNLLGGIQGDLFGANPSTISGTGTVTGRINTFGTFAPGATPGTAGTLTATGNIELTGSAIAGFDLGVVNVVGGSNDLAVAGANLVLGGTLNVNALAGWNIGTGAYRLFNYGGTLTNTGLALGGVLAAPPADVSYAIDTSVAGQVDLVVSYGGAFNWDGEGAAVDGIIQGGNGVWGTGTNWTSSDGLFNLAYVDSNTTVANFGGVNGGGTVSVDGIRSFGTLNFTADGYSLAGEGGLDTAAGTITVTGSNEASINVGISGIGTLAKTGTGTLRLNVVNSFQGAFSVDAGQLILGGSFTNTGATLAVAGGATLAGGGSFAGVASFADGAILSPGSGTGGASTLTLGGLNLSNGTLLNFDLGAANTIGGPLNDRVIVTGDLLLDGVLTVTQSAGGNFTAGIYNLFSYGNLLADNGVTVASLANGLGGSVQVNSSANQVNLIVTEAGSVVLNWDGSDFIGSPAGPQGGAGTWNATNTNWTGLPPGEINAAWQSNAVGIFGVTGAAVDVAGTQAFGGLGFQADGYVLGGAGTLETNAVNGSFVSVDDGLTATINTVISGSGILRKQGTGTLVLGGSNTNSGGVALNAGAITVTNDNSIGTGTLTASAGTTLNNGIGPNQGPVTLANAIVLNGGLTIDNRAGQSSFNQDGTPVTSGNALTLDGAVSGTGGLTVNGGVLFLNGNNSFAGGSIINSTNVAVGSDTAFGSGAVTVTGFLTTIRNISGSVRTLANNWQLDSTLFVLGDGALVLNGVVSGNNALAHGGPGTMTLNGMNTYTGGTSFNQGTIVVGSNSALGTGVLSAYGGLGPSTLRAGANNLVTANAVNLISSANLQIDSGAFNYTITGVIAGDGLITKLGSGNLTLTNANSYGGGTALQAGTITVGNSSALGTGQLTMTGGTSLWERVGVLNVANGITLLAGSGFIGSDSNLTLSGVIGGPGQLAKIGIGNLILTNANSYDGGTRINSGTLTVANNLAMSTGQVTMQDGTTLAAGANTLVVANNITLLAGGTVDTAANTLTLGGIIDGATGVLTKAGSGNLILAGVNTYAGGTNLNAGTITVTNNSAIGTGALAMAGGTTLAAGASGLVLANAIGTAGVGTIDTGVTIFSLDGPISGAGSIAKIGSGTLVLNNANSYAGGTALNAGTIRIGNNGALGTGALTMAAGTILQAGAPGLIVGNTVALAGGGTVDVNGQALGLSGVISGTGPLSVIDSTAGTVGLLTLSGTNSYTGGTIVTGTTLRVASNANLGDAAGSVTLNAGTLWTTGDVTAARAFVLGDGGGTLQVAPLTTLTVNGVVSGTGLTKTGPGTLVLNGANSYTGGTALTAGTIAVGNNAALGTGTLTATGGTTLAAAASGVTLANAVTLLAGTLAVDSGATPSALTLSGIISGAGGLTKVGSGLLNLSGASTYTGATTVSAGTLNLTGSLASAVTVNSSATLTGTGSMGGLSVLAGGTVNPSLPGSNTAGTLTVNGPASLLGTYIVNVAGVGADRITATGALTLGGTLAVAAAPSFTQFNQSFTIASGSTRTGTFGTVTGLTGFGVAFNPLVEYTATTANIRLAPQSLITLLAGAGTGNAQEVARAFDRAVALGYNPQAFYNVYASGAALPTTLLQMSGEQRATERRVVLETSRVFRETALDRLNLGLSSMAGEQVRADDASGGSVTFWLRGAGSWGTADTSGAATGFNTQQRGLLTGIDWARDGLTVGAMFHYTSTDIEYRVLGGSSNVETTGGTFYAGYRGEGGFVANGGVSVAGAKANGARAITLPGFAQSLQGRSRGTTYQVFGELAYDLAGGANTRVEPFARLTYVQADINALSETGGIAALAAAKQSYDIAVTNLGLRVGTGMAGGKVSLNASAAWQRTSGAREATTLIGIPAVGQLGSIQSVALDPDAALLQADVGFNLSDRARINVGYSGLIGKNNSDHGARATLGFSF